MPWLEDEDYKARLRPLDPNRTLEDFDDDSLMQEVNRRREDGSGRVWLDHCGLSDMWNVVTAVERGFVPEVGSLKSLAARLRCVLEDCTHLYDAEPPEYFELSDTTTSNRDTGASFVRHFDLQQTGRKQDRKQGNLWGQVNFFMQKPLSMGKQKKEAFYIAIEMASQRGLIESPKTGEEMRNLQNSYDRWYKQQDIPTVAERFFPFISGENLQSR